MGLFSHVTLHLQYHREQQYNTSKFPLSDLFLLFTLLLLLSLSFSVPLVILDGETGILLDTLDTAECDGNEARL
jgi:hypothetical protein